MPAGLSSAMTLKRIHREISDLKKEDMGGITLAPTENLFVWKTGIPGPEGSVYEGGMFHAEIHLAHDYPFMAPKVMFLTRIYHMNISDRGNVCIDILKHNWSPALSIFKVVLSLSSLLTDPNPKDPLVPSIAQEYTRKREQHDRTAREWTCLYARPPASSPKPKAHSATASVSANASRASTSTPVPSGSTSTSRASSSALALGKSRVSMVAASGSRTATPASVIDDSAGRSASAAISIDDSDDEELRTSRKRKRRAAADLDGDDEGSSTGGGSSAAAKRKRVGASNGGETLPSQGDVIVIDD